MYAFILHFAINQRTKRNNGLRSFSSLSFCKRLMVAVYAIVQTSWMYCRSAAEYPVSSLCAPVS